jgi:hypothetical protein
MRRLESFLTWSPVAGGEAAVLEGVNQAEDFVDVAAD